jgi:thioredoxin-related protein
MGTPTFHFLDANGKKIGRYDGAANIPDFMGLLGKYKK